MLSQHVDAECLAAPCEKIAEGLAMAYGKSVGALVASGSAALELALLYVGVGPGHRVLVPEQCCHQVPRVVLRCGATPVMVNTGPSLVLSPERTLAAMDSSIRAIIAVHHLGLPCDVDGIRRAIGREVPIIEDAAQAWRLVARGSSLGRSSDAVVASFGPSKPLSLGEGGGVFSDDTSLPKWLDWRTPAAREREGPLFPYPLSLHAERHIPRAMVSADSLIERRDHFVKILRSAVPSAGLTMWAPAANDSPSWQRVPIFAGSHEAREQAYDEAKRMQVSVQKPHHCRLSCIPALRDTAIRFDIWLDPDPDPRMLLISPDQDIERVLSWTRAIAARPRSDD